MEQNPQLMQWAVKLELKAPIDLHRCSSSLVPAPNDEQSVMFPRGLLTPSDCQNELEMQLNDYYFVVAASLLFSAAAMFFYFCCLKSRLDGAPRLASQYLFLIGSMKVTFAVFIWASFQPYCPQGCTCTGVPLPLYPLFALGVAIVWIAQGYQKLMLSRAISSDTAGEDKDGPIFDAVPTTDVEMT